MLYQCVVCDRHLMSKGAEPIMVSVPYVAKLENSFCCADCVSQHGGFGKFQAHRHSRGKLGKCLILWAWMMSSSEDDFMSSEGYGYCGMFGRYLLFKDTSGFVSFEEFSNEAEAQKRFDELHDDGMGAQEDDAYIYSDIRGYGASFAGKPLHVWPNRHLDYVTERRALAAIRLEMFRTGYYPNVWREERYGVSLVQGL